MTDRNVGINLTGRDSGVALMFAKAGAGAEALDAKAAGLSKSMKLLGGVFVADAIVKGLSDATKAAGNYQAAILHLQTDAGETKANLAGVSHGILDLAASTGNSTKDLANAAYYIESAGYHGAAALTILKAAAEGAKVGNADLTTVADALTTAMVDYRKPASDAVAVTDELIATVSHGKTKLEDLSGSLSKVLPAAATAHIGLSQVLGAMATMTAQGTPAANAATYLRQTIVALADPLPKARAEMEGLGLSSIDVSQNLGARGLTGTLGVLVDAINSKLGPAGLVALQTFTKTTGSTKDLETAMGALPTTQQTVIASLADLVGGAKSLQAILELTNTTANGLQVNPTLVSNVQAVDTAAKNAGKNVTDWGVTQDTLNQKLAEMHGALEKVKIDLGTELLPVVGKFVTVISDGASWLGKYPGLVEGVTFALVGAGGLVLGLKAVNGVLGLYNGLAASSIGWRQKQTAAMIAEAAAAKGAAASVGALDIAEGAGGKTGLAALGARLGAVPTGIGLLGVEGGLAGAGAGVTLTLGAASLAAIAGLGIGITDLLSLAYADAHPDPKDSTSQYKRQNRQQPNNGNNEAASVTGAGPIEFGGRADSNGGNVRPSSTNGFDGSGPAEMAASDMQATQVSVLATKQAMEALTKANGAADTSWRTYTAAMADNSHEVDLVGGKTVGFTGDTDVLTTHLGVMAAALQGAKDKTTAFANGLAALSDNAIDASRSQDGFQQQLNELSTSIDKNSKSLTGTSNAAIQNRGLLDELAQANEAAASATLKQTGSVDKARAVLIANAKAMQTQAAATFGSKAAADAFLKSIGALPDQVAAAFDGLHQVGLTYGGQLAKGFAGGIQQFSGDAIEAASVMAKGSTDVIRSGLKIQSPSKVTHSLGADHAKGFAEGIKAESKKAAEAAAKMAKDATAALKSTAHTEMEAATAAYAKDISTYKSKLSSEQSKLGQTRSSQSQAMAAAKGNITAFGDLSGITGQTDGTKNWDGTYSAAPVTGVNIVAGLQIQDAAAQAFVKDLQTLQGWKLNHDVLMQIINMGTAGPAYAHALVSAGKQIVGQVNAAEGGISQAGNVAAKIAGTPYNGQITAEVKEVQRTNTILERMEKALASARTTINLEGAKNLTDADIKRLVLAFDKQIGAKVTLTGRGH